MTTPKALFSTSSERARYQPQLETVRSSLQDYDVIAESLVALAGVLA